MAATSTPKTRPNDLVERLSRDYPQFSFKPGGREHWSPHKRTIIYVENQPAKESNYGLLHELAHAILEHKYYSTDLELLKMESAAWQLAAELGSKYGIEIDDDHIQNCLDTYRDWLHKRSQCPGCRMHALQHGPNSYKCFNCGRRWQVTSGRFVRPYRKVSQ